MASSSTLLFCCVSLYSKPPPYISSQPSQTKGVQSKTIVSSRNSRQAAHRTVCPFSAMETLASNVLIRGEFLSDQRRFGLVITPTRHSCGSITRYLTTSSSIGMVIYGYWVGPDIDDGWGYVEAVVDKVINF